MTQFLDDGGDRHNINLQVDTSAKRLAQRRGQPLTRLRIDLLQHDLGAIEIQISKAVFRALVGDGEPQAGHPEIQAVRQVGDHQFRDERVAFEHEVNSVSLNISSRVYLDSLSKPHTQYPGSQSDQRRIQTHQRKAKPDQFTLFFGLCFG